MKNVKKKLIKIIVYYVFGYCNRFGYNQLFTRSAFYKNLEPT